MKTFFLALVVVAAPAMAQSKDLRFAYLFEADLKGADLHGADLYRSQLGGADLRYADLRNASIAGAYLYKTDLRGADLRGAKFAQELKGALKKTRLDGALFDASTVLPFSAEEAVSRGMVRADGPEQLVTPPPAATVAAR